MPSAKREKPKKQNQRAPGSGKRTTPTVEHSSPPAKTTFGNDYQRLLIALRHAPVGSFFFLQLNSLVQRRQLPERLKADGFQRSFAVADFARLPVGPPPYGVLREFVEELHPKPEVLFVNGLEQRIETQPDTILELNLGRERLANLGVVVVFLLPAYVIDLIRAHALNLWSWRAHHYMLESPDDLRNQGGALASFTTGHTISPDDTPETRDRRIRILQRFLSEGLAENRSIDSLLRPVLLPLANDLSDAGRSTEVLAVVERLRSLVTNAEDSAEKAEILNHQANALTALGKFDEAKPPYQRALTIREQVLGPEHPDTATSLNNLAVLYHHQGRYAQAEPLFQRALAIRGQVLGPEHPVTAESLNNLAALYRNQGRYAQAEPLYQRALAIWEQAFGPEHPDTATSLNNLALLYTQQGRYAQAEPLYQRALAILEKSLGPEHPRVAVVLENYAHLLRRMDRKAEAEKLAARAWGMRERKT